MHCQARSLFSRFASVSTFALALAFGATGCIDIFGSDSEPPPNNNPAGTSTGNAPPAGSNTPPGTDTTPAATKDIVDTAAAAPNFKTLVTAVKAAGLEATLRSPGPFTVFGPTDEAFGRLPPFLLQQLTTPPYKTELGLILKYHALSGSVRAADILGKSQTVATVAGGKLAVDGSGGRVIINGGINVTSPDVNASNGVIHVIDNVLLPSIVETAASYDDGTTKFSSLVAAVTAAELAATLSGPGPFTVFAPSDAAFDALKAQLGDAAFTALVENKPKLTRVLKYHVLTSSVYAKDVTHGSVATASGDHLQLVPALGKVSLGDATDVHANVALADLPNRNGVIHVIDKVLIPPGL